MADDLKRVRIEELDWKSLLPWLHIFRSFRLAVHPPKLLLALLLVMLLYFGGLLQDSIWGRQLTADEPLPSPNLFEGDARPRGIFATALTAEVGAFRRLMESSLRLDFGFQAVLAGGEYPRNTVLGAIREMIVEVPVWMYKHHRPFLFVYCVYALIIGSLLGGAISRMAALHATVDPRPSATAALRFAYRKWFWFFITPLMPLAGAVVIGFIMAGIGALLFNWPWTEVVGGVLLGLAILAGLLITLLLLGSAIASSLLYPAIAVEGTDAFDAISRSFNYALGRPGRWLFYNLVAVVYGAITYLILGMLIFLSLVVTHFFVGLFVFTDGAGGANRFQEIWQAPEFGRLVYNIDTQHLSLSQKIAARCVSLWVLAAIGTLAAYAISYFLSCNTWIYLLLRRAADGTEMDEVHLDVEEKRAVPDAAAKAAPDEVEPSVEPPAGKSTGTG